MGATWVELYDRENDAAFVAVNTHFEDGEASRHAGAEIIVSRVSTSLPVVVSGDFNCPPMTVPYETFRRAGFVDTFREAGHADSADSSTFHGYRDP